MKATVALMLLSMMIISTVAYGIGKCFTSEHNCWEQHNELRHAVVVQNYRNHK